QSDTITIGTDDGQSIPVSLKGTGVGGTPAATVFANPDTMDFGTVAVGQKPLFLIKVENRSGVTRRIQSITFSNPLFRRVLPTSLPTPIGGGSFENFHAEFAPIAAGPQTDSAIILMDDGQSIPVALKGTGTGGTPAATVFANPDT